MPRASPGLPEVRAKTRSTVAVCMPVLNRFMPLITQSPPCLTAVVSMKVASEPCIGLGQAEADALRALEHALDVAVLLLLGAEAVQQQRDREVADDRALVLQVVVQAEPLVREMLADDRHGEVGAVLAAQLLGQAEAQMARLVGAAPHLGQQLLPFVARLAVIVPVGAGMLAAMVEEADIVVLALERPDLALDEGVELDADRPRSRRECRNPWAVPPLNAIMNGRSPASYAAGRSMRKRLPPPSAAKQTASPPWRRGDLAHQGEAKPAAAAALARRGRGDRTARRCARARRPARPARGRALPARRGRPRR